MLRARAGVVGADAGVIDRFRGLLPALWLGLLGTVAGIAAPSGFALLPADLAGRLAARLLAQEAAASLALGAAVLALERLQARRAAAAGSGPQFSAGMLLALGALACTLVGYYAVQPQMAAARAGQGALSFAQWHALSGVCYAVKVVLVAALAWRGTRPPPAVGLTPTRAS